MPRKIKKVTSPLLFKLLANFKVLNLKLNICTDFDSADNTAATTAMTATTVTIATAAAATAAFCTASTGTAEVKEVTEVMTVPISSMQLSFTPVFSFLEISLYPKL